MKPPNYFLNTLKELKNDVKHKEQEFLEKLQIYIYDSADILNVEDGYLIGRYKNFTTKVGYGCKYEVGTVKIEISIEERLHHTDGLVGDTNYHSVILPYKANKTHRNVIKCIKGVKEYIELKDINKSLDILWRFV